MTTLREAWNRIQSFFHKQQRDADLDAELQSHLELAIEENLQQGMAPDEARRKALIRFGGIPQAKEQQREARGLLWLDILLQDLRFTFRTLRRDPTFTIIAVIILGLGIGANVVVFSVVNTVLLRPLPFRNPEQLVRLAGSGGPGGESSATYSADAMQEFQQRNRSFQEVTGYFAFSSSDNYKLIGNGQPLPVTGLMIADNFFNTLAIQPTLGRLFTPEECLKNSRPVTLLSHAFWKRQFHADPNIVGQTINMDNRPVTVVGVLPDTFDFGAVFSPGARIDIYTPAIMDDIRHWGNTMALVGRLKPGVTVAQAQSEADLLFPKLDADVTHPDWKPEYTTRFFALKDYVSGKLRRSLIVLWAAVGMILLIVCVNLSNLLLAHAAARGKEFALRSAIGASRARLIRQLLTESLVLSGAGALLGLITASAVVSWLAHQGSIALPLFNSIRVDGTALAWTVLIAVLTAAIFGLVPSLKMASNQIQESLKDGGHGTSEGRQYERLRSILVISEVALACVLLVGAGLLLHSFLRILDIDLGFQPSRAAAIQVDYDDHDNADLRAAIWHNVITRVKAIPGVEDAGISDNLPLSRNRSWGITAKGKEFHKGELQDTFVYIVSPGYLRSIGMHLVKGRDITWDDTHSSQKVVIINESVAKGLWPGEDPIGRTAKIGKDDVIVAGVIADVRESNVEDTGGWEMYLPATQAGPDGAQLVVRTKLPPEVLTASVMSTLRDINPSQPATEFKPLKLLVEHALSPRRFFVLLVSVFAILGLILAALGIYGVISYSVTQKTQEIGIRMALGATQSRVQLGVVIKTLTLAIIGIAIGTTISFAASRLIATLLFGTEPTDPAAFLSMILLIGLVALLAGYIPARRASRIDPMVALRNN
jgi:predicted permease